MKEIWIRGMRIEYNEWNVRVMNSYREQNKYEILRILYEFKVEAGYKSRRSIWSWRREWIAHNRMYNMGLFKSHTRDTDLEEHEKWWRLIVYWIIGGI